jgi:pimeloyl-ACP methyl ester carboxylesterase
MLPSIGAGGLLHPGRRMHMIEPPAGCANVTFAGDGVPLAGWRCVGAGARRGTVVYLHGIADNRSSAAGVLPRFTRRGFDAIAYDSRAHGESGGDACTYGFFEKRDLARVLETVDGGPIILLGASLGAAVALQHAAGNPRVSGVVAAEVFADLRTVATERAPFVFTRGAIEQALALAEERGHFEVDAVSPVTAAAAIDRPVILIHGEADVDTPPEHARRVLAALNGPKRLILVPGAGHNESLRGEVWPEIERWVDNLAAPGPE